MQWSRVKSILIMILLLIDGFLIVNIAGKYVSNYYRAAETAHNITEILERRGIRQGELFALPETHTLPVLQIDRSRADEDRFAAGLLGQELVRTEQPDGGTVYYESAQGVLNWRDGGVVSGTLRPVGYVRPQDAATAQTYAREILKAAGISASVDWACEDAGVVVTASFPTAGVPVFNRTLTLIFREQDVEVAGWWTFGMPYITKSGNYVAFSATDALFNLISKNEVTEIDKMELGFLLSESGGGRVQMTPGWRVETNAGSFFVDSLKKSSVSV